MRFLGISGWLPLEVISLVGCASDPAPQAAFSSEPEYFGTREPWAQEAIYLVMTDRFVDGDPSNNHMDQGGEFPSWEGRLEGPDGEEAFIGYMGGDFKG